MRTFILTTVIVITLSTSAQNKVSVYEKIDKIALDIPENQTKTVKDIAAYINLHFKTDIEKSRAIFIWITKNIIYDYENMSNRFYYTTPNELVEKVLNERKGVCQHYSELFNALSNLSGVKSYVIAGYTKQSGTVDYSTHIWCASLIDSVWYFTDPTWGSGYIQNSKYIQNVNEIYFKANPDQIIKTHMPFDPLWQFSNYPVTNQEFFEDKNTISNNKLFFNFSDTLKSFEKESVVEKLKSSNRRIKKNGVINSFISNKLEENDIRIEYYEYNNAVEIFNDAIQKMNVYITYRNNQFKPVKSYAEIKRMLSLIETSLTSSRQIINGIKGIDPKMAFNISQLNNLMNASFNKLNEQKAYLDKYFKYSKS
jgi:transglutaminase/protease-like cytokinesis protein 3